MCATIRSFRDIRYSLYGYHVVGTWMHHGSRIVGAGEGRMDEYHSKGWFTSVLFGRGLECLVPHVCASCVRSRTLVVACGLSFTTHADVSVTPIDSSWPTIRASVNIVS